MELPRLYPILDTDTLSKRGCLPSTAAAAMLEAGARILQFRHKGKYSRDVFNEAEHIAGLCRAHGALYIIDDRADIAMMLEAGLHVGQDDVPVPIARRLIDPGRVLGFSTHNAGQLAACQNEPIDYIAFGPVFATASKERPDPVVGLEGIRAARGMVKGRPLVAIGGVTRGNALEVLEAGADSVAVIGDLMPEPCDFDSIRDRTEEWLRLVNR